MFLHKDYIRYSIEMLKKLSALKSFSDGNVQEADKFLNEMNTHVENSIKEAMSHNSSYNALVDIMSEHPRGVSKPLKLKKWAIDLLKQLKDLDSSIEGTLKAVDAHKKHKDEHTTSHALEKLKELLTEIEKYGQYSSSFANALAKEEETADHIDHVKVKSEVSNALISKKHLSQVYVNNIVSWF
jgi:methyltransferase-like protein